MFQLENMKLKGGIHNIQSKLYDTSETRGLPDTKYSSIDVELNKARPWHQELWQ